MALAANSIVAITRASLLNLTSFFGKKPLFGRIIQLTGQGLFADVLWENGKVSSGVTIAALDEVNFGNIDPAVVRMQVYTGAPVSDEFDSVIVALYTRSVAGSGPATSMVLLKNLNVDQYLECRQAEVVVQESR